MTAAEPGTKKTAKAVTKKAAKVTSAERAENVARADAAMRLQHRSYLEAQSKRRHAEALRQSRARLAPGQSETDLFNEILRDIIRRESVM